MTAQPASQQEPLNALTEREIEVLYLLFNPEMDLSDIARKLFISRSGIAQHTLNIYTKLQVTSRFEAICKFAQLDPDYREAFFNFLNSNKAA
jgi:DNA-binding NarL/FixJ family response regulator